MCEELYGSNDYRLAIKKILKNQKTPVSLEQFARRCGIRSKGVLSEVLNGKRPITAGLLPKVIQGLKFKRQIDRKYFETLVFLEEEKLRPKGIGVSELEDKKRDFKARGFNRKTGRKSQINLSSVNVFRVYAGLSSDPEGLTIRELAEKSILDPILCQRVVNHLVEKNVVIVKEDRFFLVEEKFDLEKLGADIGFSQALKEAFGKLKKEVEVLEKKEEELYFLSSFSINSKRKNEFKDRLREAIYDVMDEFQEEPGDSISTIALGTL